MINVYSHSLEMVNVSEESLLDYFYSVGGSSGKVKNADILKIYKPFIGHNDLQLRAKYREEFKVIIDRIAVVKAENGEKYLVLKKKYRQMLLERDAGQQGMGGSGQILSSQAHSPATIQWEGSGSSSIPAVPHMDVQALSRVSEPPDVMPVQSMWCGGSGVPTLECPDQTRSQNHSTEDTIMVLIPEDAAAGQPEESAAISNGEDELDKDSGSKSESEQDEEGMGSVGPPAVALDPTEKEWLYSAACARVSCLSQLLRQDPSLANKKDFTSGFTALHWAAKHGKEDMASLVANAGADVNIKSHGGYTPLHIAALHGHHHILNLLIESYGAKENLRDYSGHLACHYLGPREHEVPEEDGEIHFQVSQVRDRGRNSRKLASLFQSKKKWGSAEELAPIEEERSSAHQLTVPAFRPRKFSR